MKYRLERLNQVQYADDELRRKELEAKGFRVVSELADPRAESFGAGNAGVKDSTEKPKTTKKAKTAKKTEPAEGEEKDAG